MKEDISTQHPAFGMLQVSRVTESGNGSPLFGSLILHRTSFRLRVYRGELVKDGSYERYRRECDRPLIELILSPMQLIEMMTSMDRGDGIPCTLVSVDGKRQERLDQDVIGSSAIKAQDDFDDTARKAVRCLDGLVETVKELRNKPRVTKSELTAVIENIELVQREIGMNLPFVQKIFSENIEKGMVEAQASIDALLTDITINLGMKALQEFNVKAIGGQEEHEAQ